MKTIALIATLFFSVSTMARSVAPSARAHMDYINLDDNSPMAEWDVRDVSVEVNFVQDFIQLEMMLPWSCPPNALCALVMPMRFFKVEGFDQSVDNCGGTVFEAISDERPVDGIYERITVIDNTTNTCLTYRALEPTSVIYEVKYYDRLNGKEVHYIHTFEGSELR